MQKWLVAVVSLLVCISNCVSAQGNSDAKVYKYIEQYRDLAVAEQKRSGVPAAITLAQGIHETSAGESELATIANNHFGIKCKKEWTGETFAHTDDAPNECFRKYSKAEESYADHSDYLSKSPRYSPLFKCDATDYRAWAVGLKKCGYATNPRYAQVLIKLIEDYKLDEYTHAAINKKAAPLETKVTKEIIPEHDATGVITPKVSLDASVTPPAYGQVVKVNGLKAVYARKGDMPLEHAIKNNVRYERFLEINEITEKPLPHDMFLYLEKKNPKGLNPVHIVKDGETLAKIAQTEGILLKSLRSFNLLKEGEEPMPGSVLELQKQAASKPGVIYAAGTPIKSKSNTVVINEIVEPTKTNEEDSKTSVAQPEEITTAAAIAEPATLTMTSPAIAVVTDMPTITTGDAAQASTTVANPTNTNEDIPTQTVSLEAKEGITAATSPDVPSGATLPVPDNTTPEITNTPNIEIADIPLTPDTITKQEEIKSDASVGPPTSVNEIPEKTLAAEKPVEKKEPVVQEQPKTIEPPKNTALKSELDLLKSKFDKVVYAKPVPATNHVKSTETPKTDTIPATAIPTKTPTVVKENPITSNANLAAKFYTVKKGDTAFSIAKANGITVSQLREWNGMDFVEIKVGQKLRVKQ